MNIHDIANIAGVSASTVSKVMNSKDQDISEETRNRVLQVIEAEHYVPYSKFRKKEEIKSHLLGLILQRDNRERENLLFAAEEAAAACGYSLIVSCADTPQQIQQSITMLEQRHVSSLIIDSTEKFDCGRLEDTTLYLSHTKHFSPEQRLTFYYRMSEAGRLAAERLIDAGHQKIACIVEQKDSSIADGYRLAMHDHNYQIQPVWIHIGSTLEEIEKLGIQQSLSENVTAVICGSQAIACCVWKQMERSQTIIPDALSMIVVGDSKLLELLGYGISAVRLPTQELMHSALAHLTDIISSEKHTELMRHFPPEIVERNSIVAPPQTKQGEKILVVGSMNMDITIEVSKIPVNGETQLAQRIFTFPGGKGGNQAVGAGKLGGQVYMIGCLGHDADGKQLYSNLLENHVHMDGVIFDTSRSSGKAYIALDRKGESTIVVYQGANLSLNIKHINQCRHLFQSAKYCLISTEIPEEIVAYTLNICSRNKIQVILKPCVDKKLQPQLLPRITYFVPNESELHNFVPGPGTIEEKAEFLLQKGIPNIIVTLGERGCYLKNQSCSLYFDGSGFEPVDTTGGADSFISALAVYLSEGRPLVQAIGFAIYASGITVTRYGVQPALPERKAVDIYEDEIFSKYHF